MSYYHERYSLTPRVFEERTLLYQVFAWFAGALCISGLAAAVAVSIPAFQSPGVMLLLSITQLIIVILLSATLSRWSYSAARMLFVIYALLSGMTLSVIGVVYQLGSIVQIFFIAACMFLSMAIYGWLTQRDLAQYRSLLIMTLWGVVLTLMVNIWFASSMIDMIVAVVGVLLFAALTAYDIQFIKRMGAQLLQKDELWYKVALLCALQLYLDFINLFLSLLRIGGRQNER